VPKALRSVEILGIQQARKWNCGSLNEFRKFFGLKPHETFEEVNSDPDVANQLRHLYEHPDFVELYPGLVAEEAKKPMVPGVGIAPTYTVSRAVLSDAVALVRGDRFYTVSWILERSCFSLLIFSLWGEIGRLQPEKFDKLGVYRE
jgi:linoleate 10R-lipoxygenase